MPGVLDGWKVIYHAVDAAGKPVPWFGPRQEFVAVAPGSTPPGNYPYDTVVAVLNSNGKGVPAGTTLVFDSITLTTCAYVI
jgi:hypothetical protein